MMKTKGMILGALVAMLTLSTTMFAGADHRGPRGEGKEGMGPLEKLDLTDAQKTQIKALHEQFQSAHQTQFDQMKSLHEQMREQMKNKDKAGAEATRTQLQAIREGMKADHEALRAQVEAILTADQKAKLAEMKANHEKKMDGKKEKGGKRGKHGKRGAGSEADID